ncbi:ribosomal protein L12 (plastid) [Cryptomonas paramecium]|uniref:Ribosomal protein L12 n=1 Tax=Cryptomonas paramaecium TaxID=2898 RepID=D2ISC9_9CRYP|nr:ribosomal protein L12 [Cryptomonas paramecium]ACT46821.1 ribosomal protein L12 [Cryptomonas paramecium]BDA97974.1 ribosomal protein L12 [Cryptomonas paramecium]
MTTKVNEVLEQLKSLTLVETAELIKQIETTFNVSACLPTNTIAAISAPATQKLQESEEKTEFNLVLEGVPADKKIAILKVVRTLTGLGLKEAKDLVESTPKNIKENVTKDEVQAAKKQLEEAGAKVTIK